MENLEQNFPLGNLHFPPHMFPRKEKLPHLPSQIGAYQQKECETLRKWYFLHVQDIPVNSNKNYNVQNNVWGCKVLIPATLTSVTI